MDESSTLASRVLSTLREGFTMKTTARILASFGIGAMVLGLAAFRDPGALQTAPSNKNAWTQARMIPSSLIPASMDRMPLRAADTSPLQTAWSPAPGTATATSYAGNHGWWGRDRGRDKNRDRDRWRHQDNGKHRGWWKKDHRRDRKHWDRDRWNQAHHARDHHDHDHDHDHDHR
jgi:hypothetical protein